MHDIGSVGHVIGWIFNNIFIHPFTYLFIYFCFCSQGKNGDCLYISVIVLNVKRFLQISHTHIYTSVYINLVLFL